MHLKNYANSKSPVLTFGCKIFSLLLDAVVLWWLRTDFLKIGSFSLDNVMENFLFHLQNSIVKGRKKKARIQKVYELRWGSIHRFPLTPHQRPFFCITELHLLILKTGKSTCFIYPGSYFPCIITSKKWPGSCLVSFFHYLDEIYLSIVMLSPFGPNVLIPLCWFWCRHGLPGPEKEEWLCWQSSLGCFPDSIMYNDA